MKDILVLIIFLLMPGFVQATEITMLSVEDFKKIEVLLDEQFESFHDSEVCIAENVIHKLNLRLKSNSSFDIISSTQYMCKGQPGRNQGESCRVVKNAEGWVLDYCD